MSAEETGYGIPYVPGSLVELPVPANTRSFVDTNGSLWERAPSASQLSVEQKTKIINEILLPLRSYQILGLIESRAWIETLFPEFGDIRDKEMDEYLRGLANNQTALQEEEDVDLPE